MFQGNRITSIHPQGGLIAGDRKSYELHCWGGVVMFTDPHEVALIDEVLEQVASLNKTIPADKQIDPCNYLQHMIDEENLLGY